MVERIGKVHCHSCFAIQIAEAYKQTFQWVWNEPASPGFFDWLRVGNGIFWISGKAGAGKIHADGKHHRRPANSEPPVSQRRDCPLLIGFFQQNGGTFLQNSLEGLLRTMLLQIFGELPSTVGSLLCRHYKILNNNSRPWALPMSGRCKKCRLRSNPSEL